MVEPRVVWVGNIRVKRGEEGCGETESSWLKMIVGQKGC